RELHRFYGVSSLANLPRVKAYEASFRRRAARQDSSYALAAWIRCAELRASEMPAESFDKGRLWRSLNDILVLRTKDPAELVPELKGLLARLGVVLVLLTHFPKTDARGATFWIKPDKAVLLMSPRPRRPDTFWFNLFHEIGHLLLHGKRMFIDAPNVPPELARLEKEADDFACKELLRHDSKLNPLGK
ncbi:MAG: ImmA/IrrE family metallo-endopeptidase, partial [Acidobacteriota bacterium]